MKKKDWGFDVRDMDRSVRPQDDFYHYVGGNWLTKNPVPPQESRWGSFLILRYDTEKKLRAIVTELQNTKKLANGSPEQKVRDFYLSGLDLKRRSTLGLTPLQMWLDRIKKIEDVDSLVRVIAHLEKIGGAGPWSMGVDQDMKDSERYLVHLGQSGLGMPDRDYYLKNDAESARVRTAYGKHLEAIAKLMGKSVTEAKRDQETILRLETAIAKISMAKEDIRDVDKTYHRMSVRALAQKAPGINWQDYLKIVGAPKVKEVVVMQPKFFAAMGALLAKESIADWQTYLTWHLVGGAASYLTPAFEKQNFAFYGTTLSGVKVMKPLWRRALGATNGALGELLGQIYVKQHFSHEEKKEMNKIVDDLFAAYEARIKNLDWMSGATKKKALVKLRQVNRKIGYPDKWRSYKNLEIIPDDYLGNALRAVLHGHQRAMRRLNKPVDRKEWFMSPQTVNAYCSFGLNDVVFPAAILQPPFFSLTADDALNYGSIGSVIGHEITHAFDDQGSKFDGKGNRKTWWTKADTARFTKKAQVLVKQFNTYRVADGVKVNGQLTLGENIADLGGVSIAFDAYQLRLKKSGRIDIDGFTPEQRFFLGFALFDLENKRPEMEKTQVLTDPHSPSLFRINGPASNLPEFYAAFAVKKGDKLYRAPNDRAKIW